MLRRQVLAAAGVLALLIAGLTTYRASVSGDDRASIELPLLVKSAAIGKRKQLTRHAAPTPVLYVAPQVDDGVAVLRRTTRVATIACALVATPAHTRVRVARGPPA